MRLRTGLRAREGRNGSRLHELLALAASRPEVVLAAAPVAAILGGARSVAIDPAAAILVIEPEEVAEVQGRADARGCIDALFADLQGDEVKRRGEQARTRR